MNRAFIREMQKAGSSDRKAGCRALVTFGRTLHLIPNSRPYYAFVRISLRHLRQKLRDAAPDAGRRPRPGMSGVPVAPGRSPVLYLFRRRRMRAGRRLRPVHLRPVNRGRSAAHLPPKRVNSAPRVAGHLYQDVARGRGGSRSRQLCRQTLAQQANNRRTGPATRTMLFSYVASAWDARPDPSSGPSRRNRRPPASPCRFGGAGWDGRYRSPVASSGSPVGQAALLRP